MIRTFLIAFFALPVFSSDAAAWYDPGNGRFINRDPTGYVDGMNVYRYGKANPIRYVDRNGWEGEEPEEDPKIAKAKKACEEWAEEEAKRDQSWLDTLDDCPCELDMTDGKPKVPCDAKGEWNSVDGTKGKIEGAWSPYHPNATWQLRGKATDDGCGQQCTYDEDGKLITDGPSAGTPDLYSPSWTYGGAIWNWHKTRLTRCLIPGNQGRDQSGHHLSNSVGRHQRHDVNPFVACRDAGMLDVYFKYRPPNKGKKADGTPCDSNVVDKRDDDGNWILP